jgi:rubrerythrin
MGGRRFVLKTALASAVLVLAQGGRTALAQATYPQSAEILRRAREAELVAHHRYVAFTKQAAADGYPGIAYLFTAFATAELIHGQNFEKVLTGLVGEVAPFLERPVAVGSTKQNLITAATDELASVDTFYPGMLKELAPEGLQDAIKFTTYAWNTEKLHLNILRSIERWTPRHFEAVAKKIENETAQYLVCQICGATMVRLPEESCPVCEFPASNIHRIEPPTV